MKAKRIKSVTAWAVIRRGWDIHPACIFGDRANAERACYPKWEKVIAVRITPITKASKK